MRVHRRLLFIFVALILVEPVSAQQSASAVSATSDPRAVALVQRSLAALTSGMQVTDVTLTGTVQRTAGSSNESGTATLEATAAGDSRVQLDWPSGNRIEIRNHSALPLSGSLPSSAPASAVVPQPVGARSGSDGVFHPVSPNNLLADPTWFFPGITLARLNAGSNYVLSYVGQESLDGKTVLHVYATLQLPAIANDPMHRFAMIVQHLSRLDFYFDQNTALPVELAFNTHSDRNAFMDIPTRIEFGNYRPVDGIEVPFHIQKYVNNNLVFDLQVGSALINSGLQQSQFSLQ